MQDRLATEPSKESQARLNKIAADFDRTVAKELESTAVKPLTSKPAWEETGK